MTPQGSGSQGMRWASAPLPVRCRTGPARGFTLVELVMVIVIMGVLAVLALPRLTGGSDVAPRGLHDGTLAYLRYAQKAAIAQRRTVCITFAPDGLTLTMASAAGSNSCTVQVTGPRGDSPAKLAGTYSAAYASQPANFNFDALGQPVSTAATPAALGVQTLQVAGLPNTITVETVTGYVHD